MLSLVPLLIDRWFLEVLQNFKIGSDIALSFKSLRWHLTCRLKSINFQDDQTDLSRAVQVTDVPIPVIKSDDIEEDSSSGAKLSVSQGFMIAGAILHLGVALGLYILSEFLMKIYLCFFTIFSFS